MKHLFKRLIVAMVTLLIATFSVMADTTHIVDRGETLQSIAQKYGVTPEQIIAKNPQAAQFVYVGMELTIPSSGVVVSPSAQPSAQPVGSYAQNSNVFTAHNPNTDSQSEQDNLLLGQWGVAYYTMFDAFDKGFYNFYSEYINRSGWGGYVSFGANYGLVKSGTILIRFGPDYGTRLSDNIIFSVPAALNMWTISYDAEETYDYKQMNRNPEYKPVVSSKTKACWGLSLSPKIAFELGGVNLNVGLDINFSFGYTQKHTTINKNVPDYMDVPDKVEEEFKIKSDTNVGAFIAIGF